MSDPLFKLPFWVRLADPGMTFHDPVSKLDMSGKQVKEVKALTPMTDQWLRGGGLVRTEAPEGTPAPKAPETAPAPPAAPEPPAGESAPDNTTEGGESSTQKTEEAPADAPKAPESPAAPSSLEDLLKGAGGDDEEDDPATSKAKTAKTGKNK